jgi:DNA primase
MITRSSVKDEIRKTADIVELIGQFVQLKKAGSNFIGLCPFHSEKTPSFSVSPSRQMFHCFGCKKGGDVFAFWMEYHKTGFSEALKDLAERYRVDIPAVDLPPGEKRKRELGATLFKINDLAASYFHKILTGSEKGSQGRDYLGRRSVTKEIISEFRLGFSPDEWDGLVSYLRRHKVPAEMAVQAGLIIPNKRGGYYDRFRGRVIFPIINMKNEVAGFGGRVLDDRLPKYLNTPETPVFHKGASLYGLHSSYKDIREMGRVVIVEGYMDFLALRRVGYGGAVATLGTALTEDHVRRVKGFAGEAVVVFDSDEAGKSAALRSLPLFMNEGLPAKAVVLPDGHDPDSFVNEHGPARFQELLERASPLFDFFLDQTLRDFQGGVDEKVRAVKEIIPALTEVRDETQKALYVQRLSERTGIKEEIFLSALRGGKKGYPEGASEKRLKDHLSAPDVKKRFSRDVHFLNLLIHYPHHLGRLVESEWESLLEEPMTLQIVGKYFKKVRDEGPFSIEVILDQFDDQVQEHLREALLMPPFYSDQTVDMAVDEFEKKINQIKLSRSIRQARVRGDAERLVALTKIKGSKDFSF